ncbi:MAG: hypothetical protein FWD28_01705 [Treponema sp.]|nr:hypothetical protein [Treponema sp.]
MLVLIIIIALLIGIFFLAAAISLGGVIYNGIKKNSEQQKKCFKILAPTGIIWLVLVITNTILIINYLVKHRSDIMELINNFIQILSSL